MLKAKHINELKVGDKVASWDVVLNKKVEGEITDLFSKTVDSYYKVSLDDSIMTVLEVTSEHPFYVIDKDSETKDHWNWVPVRMLKEGDILINNEGKEISISSIEKVDGEVKVYNIHVDEYNNYFAGGVLVHNKWGDYVGTDSDPEKSRGDLNSRANSFNTTVWDSARTALESQVKELQAHKMAMGSLQGLINEDGSVNAQGALDMEDMPHGAAGNLVSSIREAERARIESLTQNEIAAQDATRVMQKDIRTGKSTELLTVGTAYQDQQKAINSALEKTGMVDAGARLEMDNRIAATSGQNAVQKKAEQDRIEGMEEINIEQINADAQAERDKQNAIVAAQDALKVAESDSLIAVNEAVKAPMDTHTGVVRPENKLMQSEWSKARSRMNGSENDNFSHTVDHHKSVYTVETGYPEDRDSYSTSNGPQGYAMSLNLGDSTQVEKAFDWLNTKSGSGITGYKEGDGDATTIANMWNNASNKDQAFIQVVGGKGQPGSPFPNTQNNDNHFVHEACFTENTLIEVIV